MKHILLLGFLIIVLSSKGQNIQYQRSSNNLATQSSTAVFNEDLQPFYHGVASGDPLADRVIIWTRVTPENNETTIDVQWRVATDIEFTNVVLQGATTTDATVDYTVKVDAIGLNPATTYYYHFFALERSSIIGRTRTAPSADADQLRFAITSCSNYQAGYFNAYKKIAQRQDLDAVIHLGDYIYEYGSGPGTYGYSAERPDRANEPSNEIISLVDYRTRYSLYRLDPDLRAVHQQHPFITIWDDHESTNDSYKDGAENHNDGEGEWEDRKAISKQVYFEWLPIRNHPDNKISRTLDYGNLATIINLDTRLEGRELQIDDVNDPELYNVNRTMLGEPQRDWFFDELSNSTAKWKIVSNQVMLAEFNLGWASGGLGLGGDELESSFLDIWDGYPAERDKILDHIQDNNINDVVFLTGDIHTSFSYDVSKRPTDNHPDADNQDFMVDYDPNTGNGSIAVEFVGPSVTSDNFDEVLTAAGSAYIASGINQSSVANGFSNPNPHMKYTNLNDHGYYILDLTNTKAQADYYFIDILNSDSNTEAFDEGWFTNTLDNHLTQATEAAPEKNEQPELAPVEVPDFGTLSNDEFTSKDLAVFSLYPNPLYSNNILYLQYGVKNDTRIKISLYNLQGKQVHTFYNKETPQGIFFSGFTLPVLASGNYILNISTRDTTISKQIIIK